MFIFDCLLPGWLCGGASEHSATDDGDPLQQLHREVRYPVWPGGLPHGNHDALPEPYTGECLPERLDGDDHDAEQVSCLKT